MPETKVTNLQPDHLWEVTVDDATTATVSRSTQHRILMCQTHGVSLCEHIQAIYELWKSGEQAADSSRQELDHPMNETSQGTLKGFE